jgi:hypothetical protein
MCLKCSTAKDWYSSLIGEFIETEHPNESSTEEMNMQCSCSCDGLAFSKDALVSCSIERNVYCGPARTTAC